MKTQITNYATDKSNLTGQKKIAVWSSLALAALMLVSTAGSAGAQVLSPTNLQPMTYSRTTCWVTPTGGNGCMSPQYRSGASGSTWTTYNANLGGDPIGDKNVLNPTTVNSNDMVLLPYSPIYSPGALAGYQGGCQPSGGLLPTASVSVESRILFPAQDGNGNCALFTYDVTYPSDAQFVADLGTTNPHVTSSPGYNGDVVIAAEDGNVYSYYWASNSLHWTFTNPYGAAFDASPATWPGLRYVYLADVDGDIFYLNPGDGHAAFTISSPIAPGDQDPVSASSLAVSTASNTVFIAGYGSPGDGVCAYDAGNAANKWCQQFTGYPTAQSSFINSSPVVSDSLGLVYVTDQAQSTYAGTANLYALDANNNGAVKWNVSLVPTNGGGALPYGGSPAYDNSANSGRSQYVITVTPVGACVGFPHCTFVKDSLIQVFNGANGSLVCSNSTGHIVSQSSPEVVDGVIYIGTDDGYVLAYDETQCSNGNLPNIWTSSPQMINPNTNQPDPLLGPPVVSYNRIHAVTESGSLYVWHRCDTSGCW